MQFTSDTGTSDNTDGGTSGPDNGSEEEEVGSKFHNGSFWDID